MSQQSRKAIHYQKMADVMEISAEKNPDTPFTHSELRHYKKLRDDALRPVPYDVVAGECLPDKYELDDLDDWEATETLENASSIHQAASLSRMELLEGTGNPELCLDVSDTIGASNTLEKLLAHQLGACHIQAMKLISKSEESSDKIAACKMLNTAAKFMEIYQKGFLAVHKVKRGNRQTVVVKYQQVNVTGGGQAIIANSDGGSK